MRYPEFLKKGDTIGICAPSCGIVRPDRVERLNYAKIALEEMGYKVIETPSVRTDHRLRSSDAKTRAEEFMSLYENPEVKLIIFATGGEFLCEIYDYLDLEKIKNLPPKWTQGYSDCTGISFIFNTLLDIPGMYGQTIKDYAMLPLHESLMDALRIMSGEEVVQHSFDLYENEWEDESQENNPRHSYYLNGKVEWKSLKQETINISGRLLGGCLDSIKFYVGTKYDDVNNYLEKYKEDGFVWFFDCYEFNTPDLFRTLWQLKNANYFKYCNAIIIGRPYSIEDIADITYIDVLREVLEDLKVPVIYDADVGHVSPQIPLVNGAIINLKYDNGKATIKQILK